MNYAIGTFGGRVLVALPEGRFPVDKGSPPDFARPGGPRSEGTSCPEGLRPAHRSSCK